MVKHSGSWIGLAILAIILAFAMLPTARATSGFQSTTAGPMTFTSDVAPIPCLPEYGIIDVSGHGVFHVNINAAGDGWVTSTVTGTFTFTPTDSNFNPLPPGPGVVSYSGHLTTWFGNEINLQNFVATAILEAQAVGSDGSTVSVHILMHVTVTPSGTITASPSNLVCGS